jgi:2-oxoglutarate dehydrogenase E1 component
LLAWNTALLAMPNAFTANAKLLKQLERRKIAFEKDGELDWGLAEAFAFASLLSEGTPIRLTGQDCERGTFSHRHLVLHDGDTGQRYAPIQHLPDARASFEIHNSPLSEYACLAFEYGYAVQAPNALVLWEAQFGDFNNGAQIIIDQFIAAGYAKWNETSRLTMLLPHGYEGMGPEHSSARIERFLQLSAEGSIGVANCTTAAQYFHLLRLQAHRPDPKPLVIFTPKSLLRLRGNRTGTAEDLVKGAFRPVIDDARTADRRASVERVLLCSGNIYYDLTGHADYEKLQKTAIVRIEQLSPLPKELIAELFASYPNVKEIVWVQEEPKNMGPYGHVRRRVVERLPSGIRELGYIGRPYRSSPSEGYGAAHAVEQERILKEALAE